MFGWVFTDAAASPLGCHRVWLSQGVSHLAAAPAVLCRLPLAAAAGPGGRPEAEHIKVLVGRLGAARPKSAYQLIQNTKGWYVGLGSRGAVVGHFTSTPLLKRWVERWIKRGVLRGWYVDLHLPID